MSEQRKPLQVLSLGAGVQSSTLLLMSCHGDLPLLDAAIFADTGWEPAAVYEHLEWLEGIARDIGISVYTVSNGNLADDTIRTAVKRDNENTGSYLPLYVRDNGHLGRLFRTCTREYKVAPVDRRLREMMVSEASPAVDVWMGISADEVRRVRVSGKRWKRHVYPLVGLPELMLPRPLTRDDCKSWLAEHYPHQSIPRSSCVGCPFNDNRSWRHRQRVAEDWNNALRVDRAVRHSVGIKGEAFLHRSGKPLEEVDLRADYEKGQGLLFGPDEECLGYCGT